MIIIAVAVLLLAWGVYSMTNSGSSTTTTQQEVAAPQTSVEKPAPAPAPATSVAPVAEAPVKTEPPAPAPQPPAPAPTGPAPKVFALNNSTVQGLANRVADQLKTAGFSDVESGNFPEAILPKSVVFFTAGNPNEEATARRIADQLKITAEPRIDALKDRPAGVILVITGDLNR